MPLFRKQPPVSVCARMRALVDEIASDYDFGNFSLTSFVDWLQTKRSRKIECQGMSLPAGSFGMWFVVVDVDVIIFNSNLIPLVQAHTVLHEVAHILCNHRTAVFNSPDAIEHLSAHLLLQRTMENPHSPQEELEAETLALMLKEKVLLHRANRPTKRMISSTQSIAEFFTLMELQ